MTDEELAEKTQQGDIESFGEIVERYEEKLKRYVRRVINQSEEEVEDVVAEVFIKGYENIQSFNGDNKFGSWIYRIAHNRCIDYFRNKKVNTVSGENMEEMYASGEKLMEDMAVDKEEKDRLLNEVGKLELKYKEVIWLYFFEDKSYEDISDILRTSVSNVGVLLNRAKQKLRKNLIEFNRK